MKISLSKDFLAVGRLSGGWKRQGMLKKKKKI